jgi:hypothetical protein
MIRKLFLHSLARYIAAVIVAIIVGVICLITKGFEYRISYVNAFSVGGAIVFFLGLLQAVSFYGAFEIFGYSASSFRGKERRYKDYYEYQKAKELKRSQSELVYIPFIVVGAVFFVIGMILNAALL